MYFLFLNLGAGEILVIALFVLMFFGSKQIPELMRGLGRATRQFKDAMNGIEREVHSAANVNLADDERKAEEKTEAIGQAPAIQAEPAGAKDGPPPAV